MATGLDSRMVYSTKRFTRMLNTEIIEKSPTSFDLTPQIVQETRISKFSYKVFVELSNLNYNDKRIGINFIPEIQASMELVINKNIGSTKPAIKKETNNKVIRTHLYNTSGLNSFTMLEFYFKPPKYKKSFENRIAGFDKTDKAIKIYKSGGKKILYP